MLAKRQIELAPELELRRKVISDLEHNLALDERAIRRGTLFPLIAGIKAQQLDQFRADVANLEAWGDGTLSRRPRLDQERWLYAGYPSWRLA